MTDNFFKQAGRSAKDTAKEIAKQVAREPIEILKDTRNQVVITPEKQQQETSIMQQVMTGDGNVKDISPQEEQSIHSQAKSRLAQIEAELRRLRMQREQRSEDWVKQQESLMGTREGTPGQAPKPVEMPTGPKRGARGPGAKNKGAAMEQGRQKKG